MSLVQETLLPAPLPHPQEIRSDFEMHVGKHISMQASARITPAGVVSAGIAVAVMTLALGYVAGSFWRRR
ncbi:hypothetical protein J2T09_005063 [Neorhizobium huautlense]|uniref:Uncharacterized protein n=1 Tax=Neorhizobium huautlense TaxID=67774 RepID=A0ABT9Q2S9_9HYPH|nr:hypothetical protein [Neorhizobium huautlense]MDP9840279.1 hypothetical protein [Neorhizobium huautlense]